MHTHAHACACIRTRAHAHTNAHCTHAHTLHTLHTLHTCTHAHTCAHAHMHTCTHAHTCAHMYTHALICTHAHVCAHMHTCKVPSNRGDGVRSDGLTRRRPRGQPLRGCRRWGDRTACLATRVYSHQRLTPMHMHGGSHLCTCMEAHTYACAWRLTPMHVHPPMCTHS